MDSAELLLHPVRLRIVHAMSGGRALTTAGLCALLPNVPKATLYRHVAQLADGGVLEVTGEQRIRGAVERTYVLRRERAVIGADAAASATTDDHRRVFAVAMATLLAEFSAYLDQPTADPAADQVGYRQHALWLTPAERDSLIGALRTAILPHIGNSPTADRTRHLLSPILFPTEPAPPT
jgi:hypothetical protein